MEHFDNLIWNVGWNFPSLDETDRAFVEAWIDAGKNIFFSGQDIGWDLNDSDDNTDVAFYNNYMHASYVSDNASLLDLTGLAGDPLWDGVSLHIAGGDGADNQQYPSIIEAYDDAATEILFYNATSAGAIQATHPGSDAKIVYFAFGYEAIDNADDRNLVMSNIINWFGVSTDSEENEIVNNPVALHQNIPNPFNPVTTIFYNLSQDEINNASLEIYNLTVENGSGSVTWNGKDNNGNSVTSGIYFYRLDGVSKNLTRKMILMK